VPESKRRSAEHNSQNGAAGPGMLWGETGSRRGAQDYRVEQPGQLAAAEFPAAAAARNPTGLSRALLWTLQSHWHRLQRTPSPARWCLPASPVLRVWRTSRSLVSDGSERGQELRDRSAQVQTARSRCLLVCQPGAEPARAGVFRKRAWSCQRRAAGRSSKGAHRALRSDSGVLGAA